METKKRGDNINSLFGICPYVTAQKLLSGKWRIMILYFLSDEKCRFGGLSKKMQGVTNAALTKQLRSLEEAGLVARSIYPTVPPKTEYQLTELGREFTKVLSTIETFGTTYIEWMKSSGQLANPAQADDDGE